MRAAYTDPDYSPTTCVSCRQTYTPTRLEQKYCSTRCKRWERNRRAGWDYFTYMGEVFSIDTGESLYGND